MKTGIILLLSLFTLAAVAQQDVTKLSLSGFNITLIPADTFSYSYDKLKPTLEELKNGHLKLKAKDVKNSSDRSTVTIYYSNIKSLELENSELVYTMPLVAEKLDVKLKKKSTLNINVDVKNLNLEVSDGSKIGLEGKSKDMKIKLNKESALNSYHLITEKFTLAVNAYSTAHLDLTTKKISLNASSNSSITVNGSSNNFKAKATSSSHIDAAGMTVEKADINSKDSSQIIVKARELKSNTER